MTRFSHGQKNVNRPIKSTRTPVDVSSGMLEYKSSSSGKISLFLVQRFDFCFESLDNRDIRNSNGKMSRP